MTPLRPPPETGGSRAETYGSRRPKGILPMTAQTRPQPHAAPPVASRPPQLLALTLIVLGLTLTWAILPYIKAPDDMPTAAYYVNWSFLTLGAIGLVGLWKNQRWGWWMTLILSIVNVILTVPEVFGLEGFYRVVSILGLVGPIATIVLLFRPAIRRPLGFGGAK